MGVDIDTVDFNPLRPMPGIDASDYQVSRQFLYLVRNVRNVRHLHDTYGQVRKQKDWASDPKFTSLNPEAISWVDDLPRDLQIDFPDGDGPPYLSNHFVGNMHCYYLLNVIMVHRPQLMSSSSFATGGGWRKHMKVCYDSSRKMCRLQEAIYQMFGLSGLLCMQRGINFVIYSVLTCTMIHLVCLPPSKNIFRLANKFKRSLLRRLTLNLIPMPRTTLRATCAFLRAVPLLGLCQRCKLALMLCAKHSLLIPASRSAFERIFHMAVLSRH